MSHLNKHLSRIGGLPLDLWLRRSLTPADDHFVEQAKTVSINRARAATPKPRVPVPAAIFAGRPAPAFVLFDSKARLVDPKAVRTVFVSRSDLPQLDRYVRTHLRGLSADADIEQTDRSWVLQRVLLHEAHDALQLRRDYQARGLISVAKRVAGCALAAPGTFSYLGESAESGPEIHAANRALYAIALAAASGVSDAAELSGLVIAAIFADSGNMMLPPEVLATSERLTEEQWRLVRGHPERSAEIARRAGLASDLVLRAVLGHHERWDGGGYPLGLHGPQVAIEGRILAIADSFSAITSQRPHAEQRDAYEALRGMSADKEQFDPRLLRSFVPLVGKAIGQQRRAAREA